MEFKQHLKEYQNLINKELEKYIRKQKCPEELLNSSMEYSLMAGGKRLRPILVIATYELFDKKIERCIPYAVAIEMVHNFSLIHDDLPSIDNDDLRHGKLTNHKKFNEATAILAGDSLMNYAYMTLSKELLKECTEKKVKCFNELAESVDRMIIGEFVDTEYEGKQALVDELEYMHKNKTGALIKASVRIGAILADASQSDIDSLTIFAENLGLAFQIKDDILSEIGDERVLGKPVGNDKKRGKCTYVSKYGLEEAKQKLDLSIKNSFEIIKKYGKKGEFLEKLAIYIKEREK